MTTAKLIERKRLVWGCRRGILELDLLLMALVGRIEFMSEEQLPDVDELLQHEDTELWEMLITQAKQPPAALAALVASLIPSSPPQALHIL